MMNFSTALMQLKNGQKVFRSGWNGKNMYLFIVPGTTLDASQSPIPHLHKGETSVTFAPHIAMRTAEGYFVPWIASQSDLLMDDWAMIPSGRIIEPSENAMQQLDPKLNPNKKSH